MSFAEQMQVATLVLDYLKVVLGYPVTIPALVAFLCWIFRERIGTKIDSVRALTYKGASVQFAERAALVPYAAAWSRRAERPRGAPRVTSRLSN